MGYFALTSLFCLLMTSSLTSVFGVPLQRPDFIRAERSLPVQESLGGSSGYSLSGVGIYRPSARLILIILTEKCNEMKAAGVSPLPYYCWVLGVQAPTLQDLNSGYDAYSSSVSSLEKQRNLNRARVSLQQEPQGNFGLSRYNKLERQV